MASITLHFENIDFQESAVWLQTFKGVAVSKRLKTADIELNFKHPEHRTESIKIS